MTNFTVPPEDMEIDDKNNKLTTYQFGDKIATHYFCNHCGIFTFVQTRLNPGEFRINLGCIDEIDSLAVPVIVYQGNAL